MPQQLSILVLIVALAAILGLGLTLIYNSLVKGRQLVREGWSGIDVQLKRRADLIPNLVEVVRGYARHWSPTDVVIPYPAIMLHRANHML
jgi:LemA protein